MYTYVYIYIYHIIINVPGPEVLQEDRPEGRPEDAAIITTTISSVVYYYDF